VDLASVCSPSLFLFLFFHRIFPFSHMFLYQGNFILDWILGRPTILDILDCRFWYLWPFSPENPQ